MFVKYLAIEHDFDTERQSFRDRFFEILDLLSENGLDFIEEEFDETPSQKKTVFLDEEETSRIGMWEDYVGKVRYFEIASFVVEDFETICDAFSTTMKIIDHTDIVKKVTKEMEKNPLVFYKLAYSAPAEFDKKTFDAVVSGLKSKIDHAIETAAAAAGLLGWREFREPLIELVKSLPPGSTKMAVNNALEVLPD